MRTTIFGFATCLALTIVISNQAFAQVAGSVEDVQIRSINFDTQVLELHNFGSEKRTLNGWRFCTHDELDGFDYTSTSGLNGMIISPGGSLTVHWLNDATMYDQVNINDLGGAAIDDLLANTAGAAISIGIYRGSGFGVPDELVDHIQFSFDGVHVAGATPRSGTAVSAGLWTAATDWIAVDESSTSLLLTDTPFPGPSAAHGSASYQVLGAQTLEVTPFWFMVNVGSFGSGIVEDLSISDNMDLSFFRSPLSIQPVVEFEVSTLSPHDKNSITAIEFEYEASVFARGGVTQIISFFNYETSSFEEFDSRAAARFSDATATIAIGGDVSRFVEAGTDQMTAKIRYVGSVARMRFSANADFAAWRVTN